MARKDDHVVMRGEEMTLEDRIKAALPAQPTPTERRCMPGGHGWNHLCLIHDAAQLEPDGTCAEYKRLIASASRSVP